MVCKNFVRCHCMCQQDNNYSQFAQLSFDMFQPDMWCTKFAQMQSCKCRPGNIHTRLNRSRTESDQGGSSCKASVEGGRGGKRVNWMTTL